MKHMEDSKMRIGLTIHMQEQGYSIDTRFPIHYHISKLEWEEGNKIVTALTKLVKSGMTEEEFRKTATERFGIKME